MERLQHSLVPRVRLPSCLIIHGNRQARLDLRDDGFAQVAVVRGAGVIVDAGANVNNGSGVVDEGERSMGALAALRLVGWMLYYSGWSVKMIRLGERGSALSWTMNSAIRFFMTDSFSMSRRRAKLVKMDPVVGLYTLYSSSASWRLSLRTRAAISTSAQFPCACQSFPFVGEKQLTANRPSHTALKYCDRMQAFSRQLPLSIVATSENHKTRCTASVLSPATTVKSAHFPDRYTSAHSNLSASFFATGPSTSSHIFTMLESTRFSALNLDIGQSHSSTEPSKWKYVRLRLKHLKHLKPRILYHRRQPAQHVQGIPRVVCCRELGIELRVLH
jgi:hypothetical protein